LTGLAEITGPRNGGDKLIEYKNADIFVFPTYFEAFGLVNLEAMQYSLPVVSTLEGSIPEIVIDGKTGFLVAKQNAQLLAEKIGLLLDSRELRMTMGKNGYQRFIENYTLQHFESNINAVFQEVISAD
jgi:glycosyltransferase involved in cell wall biosynthesis